MRAAHHLHCLCPVLVSNSLHQSGYSRHYVIFRYSDGTAKNQMRKHFSLLWIFSSIASLDLVMGIDSILLSARLSDNVAFIATGVLPALFLLFFFFQNGRVFFKMPWLEIVIAGLLAQLAVLQIKKNQVSCCCFKRNGSIWWASSRCASFAL